MTSVTLDEIVFDDSIYPRATWSQATVDRYADAMRAGETFPPIILETGTNRLLDGMHRTVAYRAVGRDLIPVDHHEVPDGVPAKLYAASLSARHGDPLKADEKRQTARETVQSNPDYSLVFIATYLGISRLTLSKYVGDLIERRESVRACRVALLSRAGMKQQEIADRLSLSQPTVSRIQNVHPKHFEYDEELLREAAAELPIDAEPIIAEILAERAAPTPEAPEPDRDQSLVPEPIAEHYETSAWKDDTGPGGCGIECACGVTYDGFDSLDAAAEHMARHLETPGPVDADGGPPADPGATPDPRDRTHGAEFESYDAAEPETCLGTDMDCGRPLPCPDHPRTPEERIAAVAEVAPEFVQPAPTEPAPTLRIEPTADEKQRAVQRDARALLLRVVELLSPTGGKPDYIETWARKLGPYDDELAALVQRAGAAMAALDDLISEAGK